MNNPGTIPTLRVLCVEDNTYDREIVALALAGDGLICEIVFAETRAGFLAALEGSKFDLILSDFTLPSFSGNEALALANEMRPEVPFLFFSGTIGEERAVASLKAGAADYVLKQHPDRLAGAIRRALREATQIAERKRADEALRESEQRFRQVTESIDEVFWLTDLAKEQMIYISPAYEKIWGRTCESLYHSAGTWLDAIHPEDRARVGKAALALQFSGNYDVQYRIIRPDGRERWIHDRAFPIKDGDGKVYRLAGVAEDITRHRQLEEQFRQAQKMDAIGQLAGGIAHDFNNILGAIMGFNELARMAMADNPEVKDYLEQVASASSRAAALVKRILLFSRQHEQERKPMQLKRVVQEALKLLRASVPATIEFQMQLADAPNVMADASSVHQVVMNLATNAWHAMKGKPGIIKVDLGAIEADADFATTHPDLTPGTYVRLSVSDTGCGMNRDTIERIFDPFFTTKAPGEGTGLGLSVVHGIMKIHEGGITVSSHPGEGTTFHLYFPACESNALEGETQAAPIPGGQGQQVLFIDDEPSLASLGRKILERLGYLVTATTSVTEALALFREQPAQFDLVITDLTMPVMDGTHLASEILQIRPDIPIILTTGYSGMMTLENARELGFRELLVKPNTARNLGEAVSRVLADR